MEKKDKFTEKDLRKIYNKIGEIHFHANSGNFTLKGINSMILLLKNNLYNYLETNNPLELKPFWKLNSFGEYYRKETNKRIDDLE